MCVPCVLICGPCVFDERALCLDVRDLCLDVRALCLDVRDLRLDVSLWHFCTELPLLCGGLCLATDIAGSLTFCMQKWSTRRRMVNERIFSSADKVSSAELMV